MAWSGFAEFLEMGGDALYVWGSLAMAAAGVAWEALTLAQRRRAALEDLHRDSP